MLYNIILYYTLLYYIIFSRREGSSGLFARPPCAALLCLARGLVPPPHSHPELYKLYKLG